jgi:hypothetical protein
MRHQVLVQGEYFVRPEVVFANAFPGHGPCEAAELRISLDHHEPAVAVIPKPIGNSKASRSAAKDEYSHCPTLNGGGLSI